MNNYHNIEYSQGPSIPIKIEIPSTITLTSFARLLLQKYSIYNFPVFSKKFIIEE